MRRVPFFLLSAVLAAASFFAVFACGFYKKEDDCAPRKRYLELWHVDGFEGGTGSRAAFLRSISAEYEKKYGVCVTVKTQTEQSVAEFFARGIFPDILSYGNGVQPPYAMLRKTGRQEPYDYALPWCAGGYVAISRKGAAADKAIISVQKHTLPRLAVFFSDIKLSEGIVEVDSVNAVYEFYADKNALLIGTQRDLYRLEGKGFDLDVAPLCGFNDIYQYVSVISEDGKRARQAVEFIDYLTCEGVQARLKKIGMRSCFFWADGDLPISVFNGVKMRLATPPLITADELKKLVALSKEPKKNADEITAKLIAPSA